MSPGAGRGTENRNINYKRKGAVVVKAGKKEKKKKRKGEITILDLFIDL